MAQAHDYMMHSFTEPSREGHRRSPGTRLVPAYQRPLDVALGSLFLALASPLMAIIACLVKVSSPGPILFCQERLGLGGRRFTVFKFRTMYANVDETPHREYFKRYMKGETAPGANDQIYKLRHDPRITRWGGVLRRLGLDELPQLLNVVRGDMALVGPRPPLAYEVMHYEPRHMRRMAVKPGITGLWQVRGRDVVDFESMVAMDVEYVERQSFWLDLRIIAQTLPSLIWSVVRR